MNGRTDRTEGKVLLFIGTEAVYQSALTPRCEPLPVVARARVGRSGMPQEQGFSHPLLGQ